MDHNPYLSPRDLSARSPASIRHSGLGIASFAIGLTTLLAEFVLVLAAGFLEISTPGGIDASSPVPLLVGLGICGGGFVNLVSVGLGIAGLFQRGRNKLFAVLGIVLGVAVMAGVLFLIVLGSA